MRYGIIIGRFQPLHSGHQSIINEIIHDGLIPVVMIGSSNKQNDKNPLSFCQRAMLINHIYSGEVVTLPLPDFDSNIYWANNLRKILVGAGIYPYDCTIYFHQKDGDDDLRPLLEGFEFKQPTYCDAHKGISASQIRDNLEANKQHIDGRVLRKLISN